MGMRLRALADAGVPILGICGGFQMLGDTLDDPLGVDGVAGRVRGLGLLPVATRFGATKRTTPALGHTLTESFLGGAEVPVSGYELHIGTTRRRGTAPFARLSRQPSGEIVVDGAVSSDGLVVGTYLHGLFDTKDVRSNLLDALARRRGAAPAIRSLSSDRYAALSSWFRASVDVGSIIRWIEYPISPGSFR
jgi:adenosylcobyric acid synthase